MPKFKLKADFTIALGNPRRGDLMDVAPAAVIEAPGELVTSRAKDSDLPPLPEDAYVVVYRDEEKTWPHSLWELVEDKPAAKAAVKEN